jgi:hypothetical protein
MTAGDELEQHAAERPHVGAAAGRLLRGRGASAHAMVLATGIRLGPCEVTARHAERGT